MINQIMEILNSVYFGKYHFEVTLILRSSLLLSSILLKSQIDESLFIIVKDIGMWTEYKLSNEIFWTWIIPDTVRAYEEKYSVSSIYLETGKIINDISSTESYMGKAHQKWFY